MYTHRWQIEPFFKCPKQNLAVKHFFGNSANAVKSHIWCAICAYLVVLITIKHLHLPVSPQIQLHLIETKRPLCAAAIKGSASYWWKTRFASV
ncbi:transposase [Fluviibacter phosphoraccumulans]|uniref:transposase n=1 Tax=Fluviibacter phosphoraccumulans TaxID=1751046 RepID=UPI003AB25DEC